MFTQWPIAVLQPCLKNPTIWHLNKERRLDSKYKANQSVMGFTKSPDPQCAINCYEGAEVFFFFQTWQMERGRTGLWLSHLTAEQSDYRDTWFGKFSISYSGHLSSMHLNAQLLQMQRQMASMQGFTEALHHEVVILGKDQKRGSERERETAY